MNMLSSGNNFPVASSIRAISRFIEGNVSSYKLYLRYQQCLDQKEYDIMRLHFKAMESYGEGNNASQAMVADKVELIQMLFDGLLDSLVTARGHIQRGSIEDKNKSLVRAGRIVHLLSFLSNCNQNFL